MLVGSDGFPKAAFLNSIWAGRPPIVLYGIAFYQLCFRTNVGLVKFNVVLYNKDQEDILRSKFPADCWIFVPPLSDKVEHTNLLNIIIDSPFLTVSIKTHPNGLWFLEFKEYHKKSKGFAAMEARHSTAVTEAEFKPDPFLYFARDLLGNSDVVRV